MKKSQKILIAVICVILVAALAIGIYFITRPAAATGTKAYTVEVTNSQGEKKTYSGMTDQEYLRGLMDEIDGFTYEGTESEYGLYITSVNGETADFDTDGAYWSVYVNGEYGQFGVDSQPVADGDSFGFVYEKFSEE